MLAAKPMAVMGSMAADVRPARGRRLLY
jgi:hypothetical protein